MEILKRILGICKTEKAAPPSSWQINGPHITLNPEQIPALSKPGGAVRLEGNGLKDRILVIFGEDRQYYACINRCTHMGRRLDPMKGTGQIQCCSVSKSTFDYQGQSVTGPGAKPLCMLPVHIKDGLLSIAMDIATE